MGYMVVRGEEIRRIFLDEIAVVILENPAVAMTGCLLSELMERKIKVIFCELFLRTVMTHGYQVLLLDSIDREKISYENA